MKTRFLSMMLVATMSLCLVACGGKDAKSADSNGTNNAVVTESKANEVKRDKSFELSNDNIACTIEYNSAVFEEFEYVREGKMAPAYIKTTDGQAVLELIKGNSSADDYVNNFKNEKMKGNNSYYQIKDLTVTERDNSEANGYTYKVYEYSYKSVYTQQNLEDVENGTFAYVQLSGDNAILMRDFSYEDWAKFVESSIYIKEATAK